MISVDLPHPFGPRIATCSPASTVRFTSCSTTRSPRATFTARISRNLLSPTAPFSVIPLLSSLPKSTALCPIHSRFTANEWEPCSLPGSLTLTPARRSGTLTLDPVRLNGLTIMPDPSATFLLPRGFRYAAVKAGLKKSGRTDFALIVADAPPAPPPSSLQIKSSPPRSSSTSSTSPPPAATSASPPSTPATPTAPPESPDSTPPSPPATPPRKNLQLQARRSLPLVHRHHRRPAPRRQAHRRAPEAAAALGSDIDHFLEVAKAILTTDKVEKTAFLPVSSWKDKRSASPPSAKAPA
jgi:hypothetical protein